ncbi:S8 family serine peptidase [uncultured Tateyamaria sp.]|uniref:S8 family serine peptidase n=1 Tax=Tateyamaria sp. 1078 TaxID=3417464 RepID=UPI002635D227|nr:S8 family serine peptidase [uncultured Tateyamaria sp.]
MGLSLFGSEDDEAFLRKYDRASQKWKVPLEGPFWKAVAWAHKDGLNGQGSRIAVIDSHPDTTIPALSDITTHVIGSDTPDVHGSLVSLLVKTVAPACELHHFSIMENGEVNAIYVRRALKMALEMDVDYICMSLGSETEMSRALSPTIKDALNAFDFVDAAGHMMSEELAPPHAGSCPLEPCFCDKVEAMCQGKKSVVVAACGNAKDIGSCPARTPSVLSIGFQTEDRRFQNGHEEAYWAGPDFAQSPFLDFSVLQPAGAIGSSFAAPLFVGALALRTEARPIRDLLRPNDVVAVGKRLEEVIEDENEVAGKDMQGHTHAASEKLWQPLQRIYNMAWASIGDVGRTDLTPSQALEARLFFANTVVNSALFLHRQVSSVETLEKTMDWTEWAAHLMPYSREAAVNLASITLSYVRLRAETGQDGADLTERLDLAEKIYAETLRINPDDPVAKEGMTNVLGLRMRYEAGLLGQSI